jgi:hypothetical protein
VNLPAESLDGQALGQPATLAMHSQNRRVGGVTMSRDTSGQTPKRHRIQLAELRVHAEEFLVPGSDQAIAAGCTCSPERNNYGRGIDQPDGHVILIVADHCRCIR